MSAEQKVKHVELSQAPGEPLLTRTESTAMIGLILVSLGLVFFFAEADIIDYGSPWWTLFLGVPGLTFLAAGYLTARHHHHVTTLATVQLIIGAVGTLLAIIFLLDPNWSFTRNWTWFSGQVWDSLWQWGLVVIGVAVAVIGLIRRQLSTVVPGVIAAVVGLVFIFDINWDRVWPLAIVAIGILMLGGLIFRRR